jgi:hypothetical protein
MSNSESRWGALRACATAIMIVLCSVLSWSTAHADDEIFTEKVEPPLSATPLVPSPKESTDKNDSEKESREPQKTGEKQKPNTELSANPPEIIVGPVPVQLAPLPSAILTPPNVLPMPALAQPTASPDAPAMAATPQSTAPPDAAAIAATVQPTASSDVPAMAATPQPTASPDAAAIAATVQPTASSDVPAMAATPQPTASPDVAAIAATVQPTASTGTIASSVAASNQTGSSPSTETPTEASRTPPIDPALLPDPAIVDPAGAKAVEAEVADEPWTGERTISLLTERAIAHGSAVYEVLAVARCETGYTFMPWRENGNLRRGSLGEVGVGQWLPPVERNHWGRTPHWREYQYHILAAYVQGDPNAIWWDADALAWSMGPAAPAGFRSGWSCWRTRGPWWFV